jgi:DNA-binding transcriptional ArsR family regulator
MSASRDVLTISDPRTLRALAHPARQRVLVELYSGEVLTASEAARLCGLSPSAMSYHLRALERFGIVERDESSDGRERPWRAVAGSLAVDREAFAGAPPQAGQLAWAADLVAGLGRLGSADDTERARSGFSRGRLWLTAEEARSLMDETFALWKRYDGRTRREHPEDSSLRDVYLVVLQVEDP